MKARLLSPRTWASALRTGIYGLVAGWFAITEGDARELVDALVIGALLADYATWIIRAFILLPGNVLNGAYQAALNMVVAWYLFDVQQVDVGQSANAVGFAFLSFMIVILLKLVFYTIKFAESELAEP